MNTKSPWPSWDLSSKSVIVAFNFVHRRCKICALRLSKSVPRSVFQSISDSSRTFSKLTLSKIEHRLLVTTDWTLTSSLECTSPDLSTPLFVLLLWRLVSASPSYPGLAWCQTELQPPHLFKKSEKSTYHFSRHCCLPRVFPMSLLTSVQGISSSKDLPCRTVYFLTICINCSSSSLDHDPA